MTHPIPFMWDGDAMVPLRSHARRAAQTYGRGEVVSLVPMDERSMVSHAHEFAWLKEAWQNVPEDQSDQFPNPEALRKHALIATGWYDETLIDVGSHAGALRTAAVVSALLADEFAHVVTRGGLVVIRRAKSQARGKMGREAFQASKTAIIEWVADLIGVEPQQLSSAAKDRGEPNKAPRRLAA
jgi:hypothetical protein